MDLLRVVLIHYGAISKIKDQVLDTKPLYSKEQRTNERMNDRTLLLKHPTGKHSLSKIWRKQMLDAFPSVELLHFLALKDAGNAFPEGLSEIHRVSGMLASLLVEL